MISAFVISRNEAQHIGACIESLEFCDEVLVVDSYSEDQTCHIAASKGARVVQRAFTGYSEQRNFALEHLQGEWILYMDADERPSERLIREIQELDRTTSQNEAFTVNSLEWFEGQFLGYGGYGLHQPNYKVRVWRRGTVHFEGDIHERAVVTGPTGHLQGHVEHYSRAATLSGLIDQCNHYSGIEATSRLKAGEKGSYWRLVAQPVRAFLTRFVRFAGYRDGLRGALVAGVRASYFAMIEAKMLLQALQQPSSSDRPSHPNP